MAYMIPYYQSGLLIKFRCTDCDWAYCVHNPSSATVSREEEGQAKKQYIAHHCAEFSGKRRKDSWVDLFLRTEALGWVGQRRQFVQDSCNLSSRRSWS